MISQSSRKKVLDLILNTDGAFEFSNSTEGIIPFLNEIWDLKSMPSEDIRFSNAEQDIIQHTINNDDWSWSELFEERLKVIDSEDKTIKFLEVFLLPKYQGNLDRAFLLIEKINEIIIFDEIALATIGYEDGFPILEIVKIDSLDRPIDIPINKVPFYVLPYQNIRADRFVEQLEVDIKKPLKYFVLVEDSWDDFNHKTKFHLAFFNDRKKTLLGSLKIGSKIDKESINVLPASFTSLGSEFVSLGQSADYYQRMWKLFGDNITSLLYSLKDAAFFSEISEEYERTSVFRDSLIRNDSAERLFRTAKPMVYGRDLENLYSFEYKFRPKYSDISVTVPFNFSSDGFLPKRIVALIGKNGAGKTQLLTALPQDIARGNSDMLTPHKPMYSKVIAVSYSTFDNFEIPKKTSDFNYVYCGLRDEKGDVRTKQGQLQKFHNTWKKIDKLERLNKWKKVISNFLDIDLIDLFIKPSQDDSEKLYFDKAGFSKAREFLSSGQSIVLFVVSEIVANIRLDSLLLFDEPETHLHPNAISKLINGIAELVNEFDSYCIIATHSPIIIQEMFSRDVLIISKDENIPSVKKIGIESFGENLSLITEEVFGSRAIPKYYETVIKKLVSQHHTYNAVLNIMKEGNLPLGLNVRLYLQSLVDKNAKN